MANWIIDGDPGVDLWAFDVRRFGAPHSTGRYLEDRAIEAYGELLLPSIRPARRSEAGRGLRRSPVHGHLEAAGAVLRRALRLRAPATAFPIQALGGEGDAELRGPTELVRCGSPRSAGTFASASR